MINPELLDILVSFFWYAHLIFFFFLINECLLLPLPLLILELEQITQGNWASILTPGGAEHLVPSLCVLPNNMLFMNAMWALIQNQIKWTAAAWPLMSAPWTAAVLILLPLKGGSQQTFYVTCRPWVWRSRLVVEIHSWKMLPRKHLPWSYPCSKPNLVQWSWSLAYSSSLTISSQVGMCVNVCVRYPWKWCSMVTNSKYFSFF